MPKGENLAEQNRRQAALRLASQLKRYTVTSGGCWIWSGGVSLDGYGKLKRQGKTLRAHRFFYTQFVGAIPEGLLVCHRCDTPLCVNPKHLFLGTQLDNERDKDMKHRRSPSPSLSHPHLLPRGSRHHKAKLSEDQAQKILHSTLPSKELARKYRVSMSTIQRIRGRKQWTHLD